MKYLIDIDNTICETTGMDYKNSVPITDRIRKINELYDAGNQIVFFTGRHWNNLELTKKQLRKWGVKYHTLIMGKYPADFIINDKAVHPDAFFIE